LETKHGERESLETKDGDRESLETKDGDRESLESKERIMREWRLGGKARVPCAKGNNGIHRTLDSPVSFGPGEEVPHLGSGHAGVPQV